MYVCMYVLTRTLSRTHTSTKAQQSLWLPLYKRRVNHTQCCEAQLSHYLAEKQSCQMTWDINRNPNPSTMWSRLPPKSSGLFCGPFATFPSNSDWGQLNGGCLTWKRKKNGYMQDRPAYNISLNLVIFPWLKFLERLKPGNVHMCSTPVLVIVLL